MKTGIKKTAIKSKAKKTTGTTKTNGKTAAPKNVRSPKAGRNTLGPKTLQTANRSASKFASHAAYFAQAAPEASVRLKVVQSKVQALLPQAVACISYSMPAYRAGRVFFYFAAFKNHIGVYPPLKADKALIKELRRYRNEKGNLAFPLDEPLPLDLIGRVAVALYHEYGLK